MINVLFVCLGNICRSPMAEALFRYLVKKENLTNKIAVDSAATSSWQIGFPPHEGTLDILKKYNISSHGLVGRRLKKEDFWKFDYIIGMDESNIKNIYRITGKPDHPKIIRLLDLTKYKRDIPIHFTQVILIEPIVCLHLAAGHYSIIYAANKTYNNM